MHKKYILFLCWIVSTRVMAQSPFVLGLGANFIPVLNTSSVPQSSALNLRYVLETSYVVTDEGMLTLRTQYLNTSCFIENTYRYKNNVYEPYQAVARVDALEFAFGGRIFGLEKRGGEGEAPKGMYLQFETSHIRYQGIYDSPSQGLIAYSIPDASQNAVPLGKTYKRGQKVFDSFTWGFNMGIGYQFRVNERFFLDIGISNGWVIRDITVNTNELTSEEVANTSVARRLFNIYFLSIHTGIKFKL